MRESGETMRPLLQAAAQSWPFTRGKTRFFRDVILATKLRKTVAGWKNPVRMKRGFDLYCRGDEFLSLWFQLYADYEPRTLDYLQARLSADDVFIDVGANLGFFSLSLATQVGCRCHAFEPNPETFRLLGKSVEINGLGGRVAVHQKAVSSGSGTLDFVDNPSNAGDSFIETEGTAGKAGNRCRVEAVALDGFGELVRELGEAGRRVGAIKMDIQGAEAEALGGMVGIISEHRPILVVEMDDANLRNFGSSEEDLRRAIAGLGYRTELVIEGNEIFVPECGGGTAPES